MAEAFDPDAYLKGEAKSSPAPTKGFDPDAYLGKPSASVTSSKPQDSESTSGIGTFFREGILAAPATVAGIGAGEAVGVPVTAVAGPVAGAVAGLVAGGAVGFGVSYLGDKGMDELEAMGPVAQKIMKTLGVDKATREAGRKEHEYAALAGQLASGGPFVSTAAKSLGQRVVGGTIQAGVGAGTRASMGEDQDWKKSLMEFGGGAAMAGGLTKTGQRIPGAKKVVEPAIRPPEGATAEQKAAFIEKVKADSAAKSPLVEAAIRDKESGAVERMGPKHDEQRKLDTADTHEQGFVTEQGEFLTRDKAVDQAKRSGQLPEDHVLEIPEDGLHSGDLRKVGDKRFEITDEQPAGVPSNFRPVALDDTTPPKFLYHGTKVEPEIDAAGNLILRPAPNFDGKTSSVSLTHDENVATDYSARIKGGGPDGFDFTGAKTVKIHSDALPEGVSRESGKEWAFNTDEPVVIPKGKFEVVEHPLSKGATPEQHQAEVARMQGNVDKWHEEQPVEWNKPTGSPDEPTILKDGSKVSIETESSPNAFSNIVRMQHGEPISLVAKNEAGEEIGRLTYMPDGGPIDVSVREQDRRKGVATALYDAHEAAGGKLPTVDSGVAISDEARAVRASRETTKKLSTDTTPEVATAAEKVDPRSIPNKEEFYKHATDIYEKYGEAEALKFFEDFNKNLAERSIPIPNSPKELDDALHKMGTYTTKDLSENVTGYEQNTKNGATEEDRAKWFDMRERGEELPFEAQGVLGNIDAENIALIRKAKGMGLEVGDEFVSGQSRVRLFSEKERPGWKETLKKLFSNDTPMADKVADQADAAIERKVFGLETWTGDPKTKGATRTDTNRVIEMHRHEKDGNYSYQDTSGKWHTIPIKKGTSIWEWKDGKKKQIGHSEKLDLKRGDTLELRVSGETPVGAEGTKETRTVKSQAVISDGKVHNIERESPYRYLHDAEASARLANMGLRKMVREAEFLENLTKSELFKTVGHGPEQPLKDLPKGWVVPSNIDKVPQLRGWHFDPKTAAIIEDFAKVWDNTMWMKMTNALVKNMMLNPLPHMFNEVMHVWNARGFSGWVPGTGGLSRLATSGAKAYRDVGNQTAFYREVMREGGSLLGADPRNKGYFDVIQKEASKKMFGTPEMERSMAGLAKKLGTSVGDLYNGIGNASQKAMWFTRDVMYMQLIHENMELHQKRTGTRMETKDAIAEVERHMPNYRLPSEVMGSRTLSKVLRNPNVSMFARYHYGMVKSLVNTVKDIDPRNLKTSEGRQHFRDGVDTMLAIGVAMAALYPLMDMMAEEVFGEGAEQRRAGPYHLIKAGIDVATGEKDASALIWPVFTFNPMLLSLGQLAFNKKIFNGKEIYHPDDSIGDIASDIGEYAIKQVPQAAPVMSATSGEDSGDTKFIARQLDIKAKSEKDLQREARAKILQQRTKKGRDTKRLKGTYTP